MTLVQNDLVDRIFISLVSLTSQRIPLYLVGGAVRDLLLGQNPDDLDFVRNDKAIHFAKQVADALAGDVYVLDQERDTARVILTQPGKKPLTLDFARMRGDTIEEDLKTRDFTINAMAIDTREPRSIIDPLSGAKHLKDRVLVTCSDNSFVDDPLRVLRAVRMATALSLRFDTRVLPQLKKALPGLQDISGERIRDELFKLFDGVNVERSLRIADQLGILRHVFPELMRLKDINQPLPHQWDAWTHTLKTIDNLERIANVIAGTYQPDQAAELRIGLAVLHLGMFRDQLSDHCNRTLTANRTLKSLLLFAGLYHDLGKADTRSTSADGTLHFYGHEQRSAEEFEKRAKFLALSNLEIERVNTIILHHMRPHQLAREIDPLTDRAIYRFFRDTGEAGVDVCLLALADTLATYGVTLPQETWIRELQTCQRLLNGYYITPQRSVKPVKMVNGDDLQREFGLRPGPMIGKLLELIRESQAGGEILTREDAFEFANRWLTNTKNKKDVDDDAH